MSRWMKFLGVSRKSKSHKCFTLAEILIALAVVGIIAVLIFPVITSRAQSRGFSLSYDAEVRELMNSLEGLTLNENVKSFDKTIMNVNSASAAGNADDESSAAAEIQNVEGTAGQFLKKYTKVAKYCGTTSVGCFAQTYFKYNGRNREGFVLERIISGQDRYTVTVDGVETSLDYSHMACAILKNGMSLCISPQVTNDVTGDLRRPIRGFIDLNGSKEPNVVGRDLRSFSMDLATRTITSPEAESVIIPDTPPSCQDVDCCEEKFAQGALNPRELNAPKDPCCATLIASHPDKKAELLGYCCSTGDASPSSECCNYMKDRVSEESLPAACKPEPERTPCEKLALGDASQLSACCDSKSDIYWIDKNWDQTCCPLQNDKCCNNKASTFWTQQNPWADSCCSTYPNDPLCSAECTEDKWNKECCKTVDKGSSVWKDKCCSLPEYIGELICCASDGESFGGSNLVAACCLDKANLNKLGQSRNIDCCYQSYWYDDCCAVAAQTQKGTGKKDKNNKTWENHCCSQAQYMNDEACCKSDGKNGQGDPSQECCSFIGNADANCCDYMNNNDPNSQYGDLCCLSSSYDAENPCCSVFGKGCPPTCDDQDYFNRNLGKCCANVTENDFRCCKNGKDKYGKGEYTEFCCNQADDNAKGACCDRMVLSKDVCCTEPVKSIQTGYQCTELLSCANIVDDYEKVMNNQASSLSPERKEEVTQYWVNNNCCLKLEYKNNPVVCPPTGPCALGQARVLFTYDKPAGSGLGNADIYIEGQNFGEYKGKSITVTIKNRGVTLYHLNNAGTCDWSSYAYEYGDVTFNAYVDNNGHFYVGYNFNYTSFYTAADRNRGYKLRILNMDNPQILVNGQRKYANVMDSWCYSATIDTFVCPDGVKKCQHGKMNDEYTLECCETDVNNPIKDECCTQPFAQQLSYYSSYCKPTACTYESYVDSEDECCLSAPSHDDAWFSGCCSPYSTDVDCCTYKVNKYGLEPDDPCCSLNKYSNDPRCQTPCDKVKNNNGVTKFDMIACCDEKENGYWTTDEKWADTCCALTDNNGKYLYDGGVCCSKWVDTNSHIIIYNPKEYADNNGGWCSLFDIDCIKENISVNPPDGCSMSCYNEDGNPNTNYINKDCCNQWRDDEKLDINLKNQCCAEFNIACGLGPQTETETCPELKDATPADASPECCSKWYPGGNPMFDPTSSQYTDLTRACCNNTQWIANITTSGYCCDYVSHDSDYFIDHCGGDTYCEVTYTLTCGPDNATSTIKDGTCENLTGIKCVLTRSNTNCNTYQLSNVSLKYSYEYLSRNGTSTCNTIQNHCNEIILGMNDGDNNSTIVGTRVLPNAAAYVFDGYCAFHSGYNNVRRQSFHDASNTQLDTLSEDNCFLSYDNGNGKANFMNIRSNNIRSFSCSTTYSINKDGNIKN